jgi:hypothetical protein
VHFASIDSNFKCSIHASKAGVFGDLLEEGDGHAEVVGKAPI